MLPHSPISVPSEVAQASEPILQKAMCREQGIASLGVWAVLWIDSTENVASAGGTFHVALDCDRAWHPDRKSLLRQAEQWEKLCWRNRD